MVRAYLSDCTSHNVAGFTTKARAEKFRKACQLDFDEMFSEYETRVKQSLGVSRTRTHSRLDPKLTWEYPTIVKYSLEDVPVFADRLAFPEVARAVQYDMDKAEGKLEYQKKKKRKLEGIGVQT